ncbi:hypothetical protein PINS_up000437 [Pythium insidiosum]|nr:hypothetical protein PINS_up000437 [Pythium insidiosum]
MLPIVIFIIAVVFVWRGFYDAAETEILLQAKAARKYQIYDSSARSPGMLTTAKLAVSQRVRTMMKRARTRIEHVYPGMRPRVLFGIPLKPTPIPTFRAEKFKILLGFFQVFGGFKKLYAIPWPSEMNRLMDVFSIGDFSLVDASAIDCFMNRNYFVTYRFVFADSGYCTTRPH